MIHFRLAEENDASEILEIYRPSVEQNAVSFEEIMPSEAEMKSRIQKITSQYPWIVATEHQKILGYAYATLFRDRVAYRWAVEVTVYLGEGAKQKGLGTQLYQRLHHLLKRQGYVSAYAGITLPNDPSVKLHEKLGYSLMGVYRNAGYKLGSWHDVGRYEFQIHSLDELTNPPAEPIRITQLNYVDLILNPKPI